MTRRPPARLLPRIRVMQGPSILLGPGKADLLEAIDRQGTIRDAAAALGMSYMRAWKLVKVMNEGFVKPLVVVHRGGALRGGAELTPTGRRALELYRRLEADALRAARGTWTAMQRILRKAK